MFNGPGQHIRRVDDIIAQKQQIGVPGLCCAEVTGFGKSVVPVTAEVLNVALAFMFDHDISGLIRGSEVNDDQFNRLVGVRFQKAVQTIVQVLGSVAGENDDGNCIFGSLVFYIG
jgi:hypothetical protein